MSAVAERPAQRLAQDDWEFAQMCRHLKGARSVLEIGSRYGESIWTMADYVNPRARLVAVDLGIDPFSPPGHDILTPLQGNIEALKERGFDARLVLGNSRDWKTIDAVQHLTPFDFVFIDGDHSYAGVSNDWLRYGIFGKVVAFHDINYGKPGFDGAKRLWAELKTKHCHAEYVRSGLGIGLIFREEKMR